ncbi:CDP-alcohol phosphatidyltransferase family protein [Gammaproteobacteria bacterium]|nr:CDP-alcohol phosphatidyltransferase family protein [Gammaproteobacteria bacterium]MDC0511101.1 CDP-alcohol phosphatidyltransferase family protein [bacterium]
MNKFNPIVNSIFLLKVLYQISYPVAKLFAKYNINPNTVTSLSNVSAFFSLYFLFSSQIFIFIFLWILAEIFDICDGTVARIQGTSSEVGAFYDHFSDQVKIFLLFICISFYFNNLIITYLSFIGVGIFLLSIDIGKRNELLILKYTHLKSHQNINNKPLTLTRHIYNHIFLVSGHTMIVLPFLAIDQKIAFYGLILFLLVAIKNLLGSARAHIKSLQSLKNYNK